MLKWIAGSLGLGLLVWYYQAGDGAKLDEAMVRSFYENEATATLSRDPQGLCKLLSDKLQLSLTMSPNTRHMNKKQACEAQRQSFQQFAEIGDKADGILTMDYDYRIDSIQIAPNRNVATVQVAYALLMGGALMQFRSTATHELRREWGVVKLVKADVQTHLLYDQAALQDPAKYMQSD